MGTEQGPICEVIRSEAHSYHIISDIADNNIPVFNHQCHLVRVNKDIIKADWCLGEWFLTHKSQCKWWNVFKFPKCFLGIY